MPKLQAIFCLMGVKSCLSPEATCLWHGDRQA